MQVVQKGNHVTLTEGITAKSAGRSLNDLSRVMAINTKYRIFFPVITTEDGRRDIAVGYAVGRAMNRDLIGKSFVSFREEQYTFDTMKKRYEDHTDLLQLSTICRIIRQSNYLKEQKEVEKKLTEEATALGKTLDVVHLEEARRAIKLRYEGDDTVSPKVPPTIEQTIRALDALLFTEALVVPMTDTGVPEVKKIEVVSVPLSMKKAKKLGEIMADENYNAVHEEFLEVAYNYTGSDKKECGQNATFDPIADSVTIKTVYPDAWKEIERKLTEVSTDADAILAHSFQVSASVSVETAVSMVKKYISTQAIALVYMDVESEEVKKNAKVLSQLEIVRTSPVLSAKVEALLEEEAAGDVNETEKEIEDAGKAVTFEPSDVRSLGDLPDNVSVADDIDELGDLN